MHWEDQEAGGLWYRFDYYKCTLEEENSLTKTDFPRPFQNCSFSLTVN